MYMTIFKFVSIIKYDIKSMLSVWLALMAFAPVLAALAIVLSMPADLLSGSAMKPVSIAIVSDNDMLVNGMIYSALQPISLIGSVEKPRKIEAALGMLDDGEVSAVIKMPENIIDALIYNTHAEIEIWSKITDPTVNAIIRDFADNIAGAISSAQSSIYVFYDIAPPYYNTYNDFYEDYSVLAREIFAEVLKRGRFISIERHLYDYAVQIVSVITFVTGAAAAALISINTAAQLSNGSYARMRLNGMGYKTYRFLKLYETILAAVFISIPVLAFGFFTLKNDFIKFDIIKLLVCIMITAFIFYGITNVIAVICRNTYWTVLAAFSIMLLLMFAGGSFYPLHLFGGIFQTLGSHTPSSLNTMSVIWASGGPFPYEVLIFAGIAIMAPFMKEGAIYA